MSKRKCGSCRYFQDSKLAGSGWCHHPQRRTTSDILIMVRRNELACRDQWSHDLWADREARGDGDGATDAVGGIAHVPARPMPPATPGEIAAVVQTQGQAADSQTRSPAPGRPAEDVVLGETRVIGEPERDWASEREDAAASRVVNTRDAIFKAREAHRERLKTAGKRPLESVDRAPGNVEAGSRPEVEPRERIVEDRESGVERRQPVPPPPPIELLRPQAPAPVRDDFDSVPEVTPGFDLPRRPASRVEARGRVERGVDGAIDDAATTRGAAATTQDEPAPRRDEGLGWSRPAARVRSSDLRSERPLPSGRAAPPVALERERVEEPERLGLTAERDQEARSLIDGRRSAYRDLYEPPPVPAAEVSDRHGYEELPEEYAEPVLVTDAAPESVDVVLPSAPGAEAAEQGEDVLLPNLGRDDEPEVDLAIRVAPELPRVCRTCRDFRPAEGGGRGWCANEWAFTHRRMVDAEEPMPCETTLGSWWLPSDERWTARADISSHGQPTPLLDAVIAHHREEPLRRRGS